MVLNKFVLSFLVSMSSLIPHVYAGGDKVDVVCKKRIQRDQKIGVNSDCDTRFQKLKSDKKKIRCGENAEFSSPTRPPFMGMDRSPLSECEGTPKRKRNHDVENSPTNSPTSSPSELYTGVMPMDISPYQSFLEVETDVDLLGDDSGEHVKNIKISPIMGGRKNDTKGSTLLKRVLSRQVKTNLLTSFDM